VVARAAGLFVCFASIEIVGLAICHAVPAIYFFSTRVRRSRRPDELRAPALRMHIARWACMPDQVGTMTLNSGAGRGNVSAFLKEGGATVSI
jgi:hypothetical protein